MDRLDHLRGGADVLTPETRVLTVWGHRALLRDGRPVAPRRADLDLPDFPDHPPLVLLGEVDGVRYAARSVESDEAARRLEASTGGRFDNLRTSAALLSADQAGLLSYGAALQAWHAGSRFCGRCGAPTRSTRAGHQRQCTAESCEAIQFPRTDPAIITLVRSGERGLLLWQPSWPEGLFSTLAGFVEPGETLEGAVVREVAEEVGLRVTRTEYVASQPWPFPHSLMIGFRTWVEPGEVVLGDEIGAARWYTRDGLAAAIRAGDVTIPQPHALSRSLIEEWLAG